MKKISKRIICKVPVGVIFILLLLSPIKLEGNLLESVYYKSQIIGIAVAILGVIISVRQYVYTSNNEIKKYNKDQIQKAIDLAEYYKNNILCNMYMIKQVYFLTGIKDIVDKIKKSDMKNFDKHELDELLSASEKDKLKEIMKSEKFYKTVAFIFRDYDINVLDTVIRRDQNGNIVLDENGQPKKHIEVNKNKVIDLFMNKIVSETLNNLEYFSMHFTYETADDAVIYQSLHKTYLEIVQLLYYDIAINNNNGSDRFYTNVIELYNKWQKMSQEAKTKEIEQSRKTVKKGPIAKRVA